MKTVVILGPTASGKTGVAIEIATTLPAQEGLASSSASSSLADVRLARGMSNTARSDAPAALNKLDDQREVLNLGGAEVISADSRAIYKGMDIGTAKPSAEEQAGVKHWGIDLVEPGERFTVADWKAYAEQKISEIQNRGNLAMVVGGTGLYIDALVYDYQFTEQKKLSQDDRKKVCTNYLLVGVKTDPEILRQRITERANKLFNDKLYEETKKLVQKYGWGSQAMKSNIYQFAWGYLQGEYSLERAKELFVLDDWHLAKRQMTWFKRNKEINWLPLAEIKDFVIKCIQDE